MASLSSNTPYHTATVIVNKIASAAAPLMPSTTQTVLTLPRQPQSGDVVVVRVVDASGQNVLELPNGRLATVSPGDVILGILGQRRALKGFTGAVPEHLEVGCKLSVLNLGGVIGQLRGSHHGLPRPLDTIYLGSALKDQQIMNLAQTAPRMAASMTTKVPFILVAGTCMQAGKTKAAAEVVKRFSDAGYRVAAAKLTGIACLRDLLLMEDCGAIATMSFQNCGLPSTVGIKDIAPIARTIVSALADKNPDLIIMELGDGLLGDYNVESIFHDQTILASTAAVIVCANDFVGAWGAHTYLAQHGVTTTVIAGPATDSMEAMKFVEQRIGVPAANATIAGKKLFDLLANKVGEWSCNRFVPASSELQVTQAPN